MVFVVALTGKIIHMAIHGGLTINVIKWRIAMTEGIPPSDQRLWRCGQALEDGRTESDYCIMPNHCVFIY
jgi:hypothetical protein